MAKTTYKATAPDGRLFTRKTDRTYTHAIAIYRNDAWAIEEWCGRQDLAEKAASRWLTGYDGFFLKQHPEGKVAIVEVAI